MSIKNADGNRSSRDMKYSMRMASAIEDPVLPAHPRTLPKNEADGSSPAAPQSLAPSVIAPTSNSVATIFRAYWRALAHYAGARLWLTVLLLIGTGLLEGYGLLLLLPLLHTLGLGAALSAPGANWAVATLSAAHAPVTLSVILALFVGIKTLQAILRAASNTLSLRIDTGFICFLRDRFYRAMMDANWLFLTRSRGSELSDALLTELPSVSIVTRQLLMLLSSAVIASVQIGVAFVLSPTMTAVAVGCGVVMVAGLRRFRRKSFQLAKTAQQHRAEMTAAVHEHLAGLKITKSHGREAQQFGRFTQAMRTIAEHTLRVHRAQTWTSIWTEIGAVVALAVFVDVAIVVRHVNAAQLLVLVFIFTRLLGQSTLLQTLWQQIVQGLPAFASAERLRQQLVAAAEPPIPADASRMALTHGITVESVSFRYDPAHQAAALSGIDAFIPVRRVTALCGPSGAGKSTLADVLLGLLAPTQGRVLVDGASLDGDRLHAWRQSVGYVPQETFLFHDTVRANLLWAAPSASEAELRTALRAAAAEEFVDRLPQGLDTIVGDRGVRLSGGERQRIALARALLRRPTLLVLDEATSSLDTHNERLVQDAIERLRGEITIVVIAHRLSTVRFADTILVLEHGRVAESGTWDDLGTREGGVFRRLVEADRK